MIFAACGACGARTGLRDTPQPTDAAVDAPEASSAEGCGASGYCTTTSTAYAATFGGVAGGDAICAREVPGSHFYRLTCDAERVFRPASSRWPAGYGEIEQGECWNCMDWTQASGGYLGGRAACTTGYATVAALVPPPTNGSAAWRICEAGDWPLVCCVP